MVDIAHSQTDELLEGLERRLAKEYAQAYRDVEKKAADYFARFAKKDKEKKALVEAGKLSEKEYQAWRKGQMLTGKRWTDMRDTLARDLTNANQIAAAMVRGELNEVFAINANYSEYLIENGMRTNYGFTLYDKNTIANLVKNDPDIIPWKPDIDISADLRWNRQMITSHITQGILQGESIPNLSKRLLKTVNNDRVAAVRTARTAVTSAQNAGRQMVYDRAQAMGIKLQKEWLATLDGRIRHEHGVADGQRVALDKPFNVGGYKMMYPGDASAPAHLVYNCRCTTITVEPPHITKGEEPRKTYDEWIAEKGGKEYERYQGKKVQVQKATEKALSGDEITSTEMKIFDSIRNKKRENLIVYDDSGKIVHREGGTKHHTGYEAFDYRGLHAVHNHPVGGGYYPSEKDLVTLHSSGAKSMTVVSPNHTIKFIRTKNVIDDFYDLSSEATVASARVYGLISPFGDMSPQQYRQKHGLTMKEINAMFAEYQLERIKRIMEAAGYRVIIL